MKTPFQANRYFQIAVASVGLIFLTLGLFNSNLSVKNPVIFLLIPILTGVLTQFPIRLLRYDFYLIHIVAILGSLIINPTLTACGIFLGVFIGFLFRWLILDKESWKDIHHIDSWERIGFIVGLNTIPLAGVFFFLENSPLRGEITVDQYWQDLFFVNIIFMLLQGTIYYLYFLTEGRDASYPKRRSDVFTILKINIFSIVFIFVTMAIYFESQLEALILFTGIPILFAYLLNKLNSIKNETERRDQELSTLNHISHTIQSTLNLDKLLPVIQEQVMLLLDVNNFYVALYSDESEEIWYPFAMKKGQKQDWPRRPISDRLTDRVVQNGQAILFSPHKKQNGTINELPTSDETPVSWLGVPLISSERTIGCMAVFSLKSGKYFSDADQDVLTILSGQASVAIQNALLYQKTDATLAQRVNQLTTLEAVSRELIAASHSDQLYDLILKYALETTNSCCGAVSIINPESHLSEIKASKGYRNEKDNLSFHSGVVPNVARNFGENKTEVYSTNQGMPGPPNVNIRSQLSVPIIHEERLLGEIAIASTELSAYSESEHSFVSQLANHAAINIINAELYHELQIRLQEQSILYQVSAQLVRDLPPEQVAEAVKQAVYTIINPLEIGIHIWNQESSIYQLIGEGNDHNPTTINSSPELIRYLLKESQPTSIKTENPLHAAFAARCNNCQIMIFPFRSNQQRPGFLTLHLDKNTNISDNEVELIKTIAAQGAISFLNARNFLEVKNVRDRLSAILNSIKEGILMIDMEGLIHIANEPIQSITGFRVEEYLGRQIFELPHHLLEPLGFKKVEIHKIFLNFIGNKIVAVPKKIIESNNTQGKCIVERTTMPIRGQNSNIIGIIILIRDITEEREIEQTRDAITETIVHDVRSPMSAIVGALELLKDALPDKENSIAEQALLVAERSANRVICLTEELLDIARLQSGRMDIETEDIDFHSLVEELMIDFTAIANENSVFIRNNVSKKIPFVQADPNKLIRILTNLVENAIKYSPHGGHVIISAETEISQFLTVRVTDNGAGIPPEYKEKIFERFVQVPGRYSRRGGTGLGLAFCRLAVEAHGGQIWADHNPDGGSIFAFTIPTNGLQQKSIRKI